MGTDAAIESADIALLTSDIKRIPWLIGYARRTLRLIKTNVTLAIGIKGAVFLASLMGVGTLWLAIVADMGASLLVTANALRLLRHPTTHS
jgi:Cd2+/Zn2+-exporting ATPase